MAHITIKGVSLATPVTATGIHTLIMNRLQNAVRRTNLECKQAMDRQHRSELFSTSDGMRNRYPIQLNIPHAVTCDPWQKKQ